MAQSLSYNNPTMREDLIDVITNLSPQDTQFFSGLKRGRVAKSTLHEWPVDAYAVPTNTSADKKAVEGADFGAGDVTNPTRRSNHTQIVLQDWKVSGTEMATDHAGMRNPKDYHQGKSMVNWKLKAEWSLIHGVDTAGNATTAREMGGLFNKITTNAVAASAALTETLLGDYLELAWSKGGSVDEIYVGMKLKRKISSFTAGSTKNMDAKDKRLILAVDVYESDTGVQKIMLHRYIDSVVSGAGTYNLLGLTTSTWGYSPLREPKNYDAPQGGDYVKGAIVGEFTLEALYEEANVAVKGITG